MLKHCAAIPQAWSHTTLEKRDHPAKRRIESFAGECCKATIAAACADTSNSRHQQRRLCNAVPVQSWQTPTRTRLIVGIESATHSGICYCLLRAIQGCDRLLLQDSRIPIPGFAMSVVTACPTSQPRTHKFHCILFTS